MLQYKNIPKIGVLLTNTGTPNAPTLKAVRQYLHEFLSDRRVVQLPRIVWLPILYGLVLTLRSRKSAKLYQKIWTADGAPMRTIMQKLSVQLQKKLHPQDIEIEPGMNYGNPSIQEGLESLRQKNVDKIIVLPLFPQYSNTTTASTFDHVTAVLKKWTKQPEILKIENYYDNRDYIHALADSIRNSWIKWGNPMAKVPQQAAGNKFKPGIKQHRGQHLLISFHGIPKRIIEAGDPYQHQCEQTAKLLAEELKLSKDKWTLCYQSTFGYDKWLKPSTQHVLIELPQRGIKQVDVICPGFSTDCLETLEEIDLRYKKIFLTAGGESLRYIPALNDSEKHIDMLANIVNCCEGQQEV